MHRHWSELKTFFATPLPYHDLPFIKRPATVAATSNNSPTVAGMTKWLMMHSGALWAVNVRQKMCFFITDISHCVRYGSNHNCLHHASESSTYIEEDAARILFISEASSGHLSVAQLDVIFHSKLAGSGRKRKYGNSKPRNNKSLLDTINFQYRERSRRWKIVHVI